MFLARINNRRGSAVNMDEYAEGDGMGALDMEVRVIITRANMHENDDSCRIRDVYLCVQGFQCVLYMRMREYEAGSYVCEGVGCPCSQSCDSA